MKRILILSLLPILFGGCASLFEKRWQAFEDPGGFFRVEFPRGEIQAVSDDKQTLYRLTRERTVFAASSFAADPGNRTPAGVDRAFTEFPVGFARSVRGRIVSARRADRPGLQGVATRIKTGEGACELRLFHRSSRFFFLVVCFPRQAEDAATNERFFDSLRAL